MDPVYIVVILAIGILLLCAIYYWWVRNRPIIKASKEIQVSQSLVDEYLDEMPGLIIKSLKEGLTKDEKEKVEIYKQIVVPQLSALHLQLSTKDPNAAILFEQRMDRVTNAGA